MTGTRAREILEDSDFRTMSGRKRRIASVLTLAELGLYFGFIALIAFDKPLLAGKLFAGAATTIGIPIAVGVIFLLAEALGGPVFLGFLSAVTFAPIVTFRNPGVFSMGAAFIAGIVISLLSRETAAESGFEEETLRTYVGIGAE